MAYTIDTCPYWYIDALKAAYDDEVWEDMNEELEEPEYTDWDEADFNYDCKGDR